MTPTPVPEADFQAQVVALARICGWQAMHVRRTRGRTKAGWQWLTGTSIAGWPDLTLWHEQRGRFLLAELKTDRGELTADQRDVIASLRAAGAAVHVWRPADWDELQAVLTHRDTDHTDTARRSPERHA